LAFSGITPKKNLLAAGGCFLTLKKIGLHPKVTFFAECDYERTQNQFDEFGAARSIDQKKV